MTQRENGDSDGWVRELPHVLVIDLASTLLISLGVTLLHHGFWLNAAVTLVVIAALTTGFLYSLRHLPDTVRGRTTRALRRSGPGVMWAMTGAGAMGLILLVAIGVHRLHASTRPCGQPLELRVLTTPETLTPLRAAAAEFVNDGASGGCRRYGVSVVPETGPVPLYDGFGRLWRRSASTDARQADDERLFGPQPDIWIPSSTAEYAFVPKSPEPAGAAAEGGAFGSRGGGAGAPGRGDPYFRPRGSLGSSPLVLALFAKANQAVANPVAAPVQPSTAALLRRVHDAGVRLKGIARPVPETSAAALAVTPALYGARPGGDESDERFVSPASLVSPDAASLLCRFRKEASQGAEPPDGFAVAVPEQALHDYDVGRPLGDDRRCGAVDPNDRSIAAWRLYPYYSRDLPTLDYPFVQVRWRGQDTPARNAAVTAFRRWLDRVPLTSQGFRDASGVRASADEGDSEHVTLSRLSGLVGEHALPYSVSPVPPEGVQETLDRVAAARPRVSASLMLDVSDSMGAAARVRGGARLARGASFLQSLVAQLQVGDRVGSQVSSSAASPAGEAFGNVPPDAASPEQKNLIIGRLQAVASAGADRPLIDAIAAADLGSGRQDLVLVTDGQVPATNPDLAGRARWLAGEFRGRHPGLRLTVVLTGPAGCGASPVREIVSALGPGGARCVPLTAAPEEEQAAEILAGLR
ncbi:VWA domain-containing protein [Actinomadura roseirufa]|uniref:VWA domain-containing protein n=1 Tax=Actinomadura roseirufa TaxID=2094049 RepID=UPI0010415EF5|nr:VWA domain-containing protein [Actinomadura roseirufa]